MWAYRFDCLAAAGKLPGCGTTPVWQPLTGGTAAAESGGTQWSDPREVRGELADDVTYVVTNMGAAMHQATEQGLGDFEYSFDTLHRSYKNYQLWNHRRWVGVRWTGVKGTQCCPNWNTHVTR